MRWRLSSSNVGSVLLQVTNQAVLHCYVMDDKDGMVSKS
jgi:hypothetical protein